MKTLQEFYDELINEYLINEKNNFHSQVGQLIHYNKLTVEEAIEDAVFGRYIVDDHQYFSYHYRFFSQIAGVQVEARERLLQNLTKIKRSKNFLDLYNRVRQITQDIDNGLGRLFYYDTALRIGACKELELYPEHIFLQRGSLKGAEAMQVDLSTYHYDKPYIAKKIFDQFSRKFKTLEAKHLETFLCVYHDRIKKIMNRVILSK